MSSATLTSKGRLTLPKEIREAPRAGPGDRLKFVRKDNGNDAVMPVSRSVAGLKGLVLAPEKPLALSEMDDAAAKGAGVG